MIPNRFRRAASASRRPSLRHLRSARADHVAARVGAAGAGAEFLEDRTLLTVYTVDTGADIIAADGLTSFREALIAAETNAAFSDVAAGSFGNDTIQFLVGTVTLADDLLTLTDDLTIDGAGVLLDHAGFSGLGLELGSFLFSDVDFAGATIVGDNGAALSVTNGADLTMTGGGFFGNTAFGTGASGGAVFLDGADAAFTGTTFDGNSAARAGGAIEVGTGNLTLTDVLLTNNAVTGPPGNGGALHVTGAANVAVIDGEVTGNFAASEGGGLWNSATGTMTVDGTLVTFNTASGDDATNGGGGLFNDGGTLFVTGADISDNLADGASGSGGGLFSVDGDVTLVDTFLDFNSANRAGGGIEVIAGSLTMTGGELFGNDVNGLGTGAAGNPGNGGGLHVSGAADVTIRGDALVSANEAANEGGGLWNSAAGTMRVLGDVFIGGNRAFGAAADTGGGGIYNDGGTLIVAGSGDPDLGLSIVANDALGAAGSGGGILSVGGTVTISNALIADNTALRAGGGIETANGTALTVTDTDFTGNTAGFDPATANPGNGGAVHVSGPGAVTSISGGLFEGNVAGNEGGALWNATGSTLTVDAAMFDVNAAEGAEMGAGGGAIYNIGSTTVTRSTFTDNTALIGIGSGGAILTPMGDLTVRTSTFDGNFANRAGGAIEVGAGTVVLDRVDLLNNTASGAMGPGNGGGLHVTFDAATSITGGTVAGNFAANEGGGLWNSATGTMILDGVTVADNFAAAVGDGAASGGGGVYDDGGALGITGGAFTNNLTVGSGGGLLSDGGQVTVSGTTFTANGANRAGGAIELAGGADLGLTGVTGNDNFAAAGNGTPGNGGFLHVTGNGGAGSGVTVSGGSFARNIAVGEGGAFWNAGDSVTELDGVSAVENFAFVDGGAVYNNGGGVTIDGGDFDRNAALGSGGAVLSDGGVVQITGASLRDNGAVRAGGGIELAGGADANVTSVSAARNFASGGDTGPGNGGFLHVTGNGGDGSLVSVSGGTFAANLAGNEGGAFWNAGDAEMFLEGATIADNFAFADGASGGGGVYNEGGSVTLSGGDLARNGTNGSGGGVLSNAGSLTVFGTALRDNGANRAGGGIELAAPAAATLTNVTGTGNFAAGGFGTPGNGGFLHVTGPNHVVNVSGGAFSDNLALSEGGAFWNATGSTLTVRDANVTGNFAFDTGGGLYAQRGANTAVIDSLFRGNGPNDFGGPGASQIIFG